MFSGRYSACVLLCGLCLVVPSVRANGLPCNCPESGIIVAVGGAADEDKLSDNLVTALEKFCLPLRVIPVYWANNADSPKQAFRDQCAHQIVGANLARNIQAYRARNPGVQVFLVAHGAGAAVVLAAADQLSPDSVDRIVLLTPATSSCHDLRHALAASRMGIDVFFSPDDNALEAFLDKPKLGTTDGPGLPSSGMVGFRPASLSPEDKALYCKLRQYAWRPEFDDLGWHGGHAGVKSVKFLRRGVLPLLAQ
jgi:pimeloyl-ACP methyl ester carboxylesterase